MSGVILGSRGALLRPLRTQERPKRAQATPGAPQEPPGRPQDSPRGSQRLSSSSLTALLELSWGSLEQSSCSANLSFTRAKPRTAKMQDFDYEISREVNCQKTMESLFKNVHHSRTRAPKCIGLSHFSILRHLRRQENRDRTFENLSFILAKWGVVKNHHKNWQKMTSQNNKKTSCPRSHQQISLLHTFVLPNPLKIELPCGRGNDFWKWP